MSDEQWRAALRAHEAAPGDMELLRRAIAAGRRSGQSVGWLRDREVAPGCRFRSDLPFRVMAFVPTRAGPHQVTREVDFDSRSAYHGFVLDIREVGRTPGEIEVPPNFLWWVAPEGFVGRALPGILRDVADHAVAGLDLSGSNLSDVDLGPLVGLSSLSALLLQGCTKISDRVADVLPAGLRFLSVSRATHVGDGLLERLDRLPELTLLSLHDARVTPAGLSSLPRTAPGLTHLDLGWVRKLGNPALAPIGDLVELRQLDLSLGSWSRAGLVHLARLERLEHLDLSGCSRLTDKALDALFGLSRLRSLNLRQCSGLTIDGLLGLAALPELRHLDVAALYYGKRAHTAEPGLAPAEQARLRAALPSATISF